MEYKIEVTQRRHGIIINAKISLEQHIYNKVRGMYVQLFNMKVALKVINENIT